MLEQHWQDSEPFARGPGTAQYPSLWRGLEFAWMPHLTKGGTKILDFGPYKRHAEFIGGLAVTNWVDGEPYGACLDLSAGAGQGAGQNVDCAQWGASGDAWNAVQSGHYVLNFAFATIVGAQKPNDVTGTSNMIYGRTYDVDSGQECPLSLNANDNTNETNRHGLFFRYNSNTQGSGSNSTGSTNGEWRTVGGRWTRDHKPEFWSNGILREKRSTASAAAPGNLPNNSVHAYGSYRHTAGSRGCDGLLGPVCVWSRALSTSELLLCMEDAFAPIRFRGYHRNG